MSCPDPSIYTYTGPGATILEHTTLTWFLTTDGLLGTTPDQPDIPNGNMNQMFWKLLQNDIAIVTFLDNALTRTYGVFDGVAPAEGVLPGAMYGAPTEPVLGDVHTIIYDDFEVTYRFGDVVWVEVARMARTQQVAAIYTKKVIIPLSEATTEVNFAVPTETDEATAFAFTIDDLAIMYIDNADSEMPFVGVVPGINLAGAVVRVTLSSEITVESNYSLVAIFRRITLN